MTPDQTSLTAPHRSHRFAIDQLRQPATKDIGGQISAFFAAQWALCEDPRGRQRFNRCLDAFPTLLAKHAKVTHPSSWQIKHEISIGEEKANLSQPGTLLPKWIDEITVAISFSSSAQKMTDGRYPNSVLDAIRDRITLSELIGRTIKLKREGREMVGLCPFHQERTPSFSVNDKKRVWCCFGCGARGDAIDFTRHVYRLNFRQAVDALATEHGLAGLTPEVDPQLLKRQEVHDIEREKDRLRYREAAARIWNEALPIADSPAERYLRSRAITGPLPASLRYHPELRYRVSAKTWLVLPAMVGQILRFDNEALDMVAVHRTYLKRDGSGKAEVEKPKSLLGDARGGGVYLGADHPSVFTLDRLSVTEGIETGLSLQALNGLPTIAALSTSGMVALQLPALPAASRVTIGADNDQNDAGIRAALTAATRWRDEGREVETTVPRGVGDWNDVLRDQLGTRLVDPPRFERG